MKKLFSTCVILALSGCSVATAPDTASLQQALSACFDDPHPDVPCLDELEGESPDGSWVIDACYEEHIACVELPDAALECDSALDACLAIFEGAGDGVDHDPCFDFANECLMAAEGPDHLEMCHDIIDSCGDAGLTPVDPCYEAAAECVDSAEIPEALEACYEIVDECGAASGPSVSCEEAAADCFDTATSEDDVRVCDSVLRGCSEGAPEGPAPR